jgi:hypothetical protein
MSGFENKGAGATLAGTNAQVFGATALVTIR